MVYTMWENTPLKWHKFLTFFLLPLGTILNVCRAILAISDIQNWTGILIPVNIIDLICFIVCAILGITAIYGCLPSRRRWYGPKCAIILYAVLSVYSIYNIIAAYLLSVADSEFVSQSIANLISFSLTSGLMYIYYKKRRLLFSHSNIQGPQRYAKHGTEITLGNQYSKSEPENSVELLMKIQNDNEIDRKQSEEVKLRKKLKRARILLFIFAGLFTISLVETIYLWSSYHAHAQTYYEAGYNDGKAAVGISSNSNYNIQERLERMREDGIKNTVVYVSDQGEKYHEKGCRYLRDGDSSLRLEEAVDKGYTPCSVCNPPRP